MWSANTNTTEFNYIEEGKKTFYEYIKKIKK